MDKETISKIIDLNNHFYQKVGSDFDTTRQYYWKGWEKVKMILKTHFSDSISVLDLACGNGRFGDFLIENKIAVSNYIGIDSSDYLLSKARDNIIDTKYKFEKHNLLSSDFSISKNFDLITMFGFLHHIPSEEVRKNFIQKFIDELNPEGIMVITFWSKFNRAGSKKYEDLSETGKKIYTHFEKGDYFFGWDNLPMLERYCHLFENEEVSQIASNLNNVNVIEQYRSDGKKNPDNIYLILKKL